MKFQKWIDKNTASLSGKLVVFIGATGTIGYKALEYILYLGAEVIIGARNTLKAEEIKAKALASFNDAKISIMEVDASSSKSINSFLDSLKNNNIHPDYFINNAGVYHLNPAKSVDDVEIHFATNALGSGLLLEGIMPLMNNDSKIVLTSSISYKFNKLNLEDIEGLKVKKKLKKYGLTKRAMLENTLYIKNKTGFEINLVHPGICATELFQKGYSKFFMHTVYPIVKLATHSPNKAALSIIMGMFAKTEINEWIGPRGFLHCWGKPSISKIKKSALDSKELEIVHTFINNRLNH